MSFVHLLTYSFVIIFLQSIANIEYALDFFDYVFCTHIIFIADVSLSFFQHFHSTVAQEFNVRMFLLDSGNSSFAALAAFVVSRRSQFVFNNRIH